MKHRKGRVEGEILRELTKIIRKNIRDPRGQQRDFYRRGVQQ